MANKLSAEAARLNAEYQRKWRAAHKDKSAEYSRRYWERRTAREKAAAEQSSKTADKQ